jgi:radical SAM protein with 4Fe4S-binding SPASM domain
LTYTNLKISVSLDGPTVEVHEFIRGKETFERTIGAIQALTTKGVFVGVNMFVHQGNFDLVEETLRLVDDLGVRAFNCLNLIHVGRANSRRSQHELTRVSEHMLYKKLFTILRGNFRYQELMKNSTFANQIMGIAGGVKSHYCGIGTNRALYVRADGSIYPCPDTAMSEFRLGNVKNEQLWDIWERSPLLRELRQLDVDTINPVCAKCDVRYFCGGGCRGENYQVTRELRSPHFNCEEIRKTILEMMWMLTEEPNLFQDKIEDLYQTVCL